MGPDAMILVFWILSFRPIFSLSSFTFTYIKRLIKKRLFFTFCQKGSIICISEVIGISPGNLDSSFSFLQPNVHLMMYSAHKLNKQGDNTQPWRTPFPIWNQSVVPCPVLTVASWPAYRFLRRHVKLSGIPISKNFPQCIVIHTVKGFGIVIKAEIDVFLKLFCFFDDPTDVGNSICGSSAFSKFSLNIWKFMVHVLLKPGLENFEHYFTSMWDEWNCAVVWAFFGIAFLWG